MFSAECEGIFSAATYILNVRRKILIIDNPEKPLRSPSKFTIDLIMKIKLIFWKINRRGQFLIVQTAARSIFTGCITRRKTSSSISIQTLITSGGERQNGEEERFRCQSSPSVAYINGPLESAWRAASSDGSVLRRYNWFLRRLCS